jgi:predicted helicase
MNIYRRGGPLLFPLHLHYDDGTTEPNLNRDQSAKLVTNLSEKPSPEDTLDYIYAILYSSSYRKKYKDLLLSDFPYVPVPTQVDFDRLVPLGRDLRKLHLMKSNLLEAYDTTFPTAGDAIVENRPLSKPRIIRKAANSPSEKAEKRGGEPLAHAHKFTDEL